MKRLIAILAMAAGLQTAAWAAMPAPLTTVRAITSLSKADAGQGLPVWFEATVTYIRDYEPTLFVQDDGNAMYIHSAAGLKLLPGDRIQVRGTTSVDFLPYVESSAITVLHHGTLPKPVPATFEEMIQARLDCVYVVVRGVIRSADVQLSSGRHVTQLELLMNGGYVGVTMDNGDPARLNGWLDSEAEITGVAAGRFDGKMQQAGILIHASSFRDVKILRRAMEDPWSIPVTPMDKVLTTFNVDEHTGRVRVEGTITYYHQTQMAVLQDGLRSIRVLTPEIDPLQVGDRAEAIGIPFVDNGFLTIKMGAIRSTGVAAPVVPVVVNWEELASSKHAFDLISIEGKMVTQVREQAQDVYIISSQGHLFSATVRHPFVYEWGVVKPPPPMPRIAPDSKVRVTGVAILDDGNPFNGAMAFGILLRSADDVAVISNPSWLNVQTLTSIVIVLLVVVIAVGAWGWMLRGKVHRQTAALATRIEAEAEVERRRSRILEDINGGQPLVAILEQIANLVSFSLGAVHCCCQVTGDGGVGDCPPETEDLRVIRHEIPARVGPSHGMIHVSLDPRARSFADASDVLSLASGLATLAIETSQLYSDLVHRSEFDMLTDIQNRFSLERSLDAMIPSARQAVAVFGLIYLDLNDFKKVNDQYGHQAGDIYLQQVADRMKRQLRPVDTLARLGGDEFGVLVPKVRNRAAVEDIALRLECCFDAPFELEGYVIHGTAAIGIALYPADATSRDGLLSAADAAMYAAKHTRKRLGQMLADESRLQAEHKTGK